MRLIKRKPAENESLAMVSLASAEQVAIIDSRRFIDLVSGLRHGPSFCGDRPYYRDSDGRMTYLDSNLTFCITALCTSSRYWVSMVTSSSHPLIRASLALNQKELTTNRKAVVRLSRHDPSFIVREAAKSSLQRRPMRASDIKGVSSTVADLSVAYLTMLQQLYHLSSAYLAVEAQVQELTVSLQSAHRDLRDAVADQLRRMQTYKSRIRETVDGLLPKFQSVMFMMRQVECASEIGDHLSLFNNSGVEAVVSKLPSLMADALGEIDRLYANADVQVGALGGTDDIDRLLKLGD